jgi:hypothetical protein
MQINDLRSRSALISKTHWNSDSSRKKYLLPRLIACLLLYPLPGALAQSDSISIQFLATFSYPGSVYTRAHGINDRGEIVGTVVGGGVTGGSGGFIRYADGTFSPVLIEPNDTASDTEADGVNNGRLLVGTYYVDGSDFHSHGYFYQHGSFTEFNIPSATDTVIYGVNNAGDFVGLFSLDNSITVQGFANIGGNLVTFGIPGSIITEPAGINDRGEIAGFYYDTFTAHGFFRDAAGNLTYPIDPPGSVYTFILGINGHGGMVGFDHSEHGGMRGFFFKMPNTFVPIDYPGAIQTVATGINRFGVICGWYDDGLAVRGFVAQISRDFAK